jgi:hypothetical protein
MLKFSLTCWEEGKGGRRKKDEGGRRKEEEVTPIKPRDPHLAVGE